ncbi:hypothetical protein P872_06240 [Rhodonellum psychrophilum GCM71 = DSM 17998]|uniref:DUF1146 domain-containing protein n=2 Tax=Rhodonellum TaxID=336827 RepID=U5BR51_9BACT|nr:MULTISPECIES: hypothetical protein [Rhodonellum]ERM83070.1 hypothetical protein P872_06240 [Rhodonellum psychrophilum GCM71 = DSM 17998]SDZ47156.1 hypothetical protein SAMN05444412_11624 [Rhodonellum ikkaensis]
MEILIVACFLLVGFLLSIIQERHLVKPFLSRKGFTVVSLASFSFYLLGAFASLRFLFEKFIFG